MINDDLELSHVSKNVVVIPAAGKGMRFGDERPKQYQIINGKMVLDITLELFLQSDLFEKVILIVSPDDQYFEKLTNISDRKIIVIDGGEERQLSVTNGLRYLYDNGLPDETPILVHDAVRPCLTQSDLQLLLDFFESNKRACFLAEKVTDSLKKVNQEGLVVENVERENIIHALTPQMASFIELKNSLSTLVKNEINVTDEVSALIGCDIPVKAIMANSPNPKITRPKDLLLAEKLLSISH